MTLSTRMNRFDIRPANHKDIPVILSLIKQLAEYEKMADEVVATEDILRKSLFGSDSSAEAIIASFENEPVGFALFFHNFSTFLGTRGLYLEDLYVVSEFRGRGFGKALLVYLSQLAVERECGRFEWSVLDWNEPAISFYKSMDAVLMDEWTVFRLSGKALHKAAGNEW